jgi:hypothetical protein
MLNNTTITSENKTVPLRELNQTETEQKGNITISENASKDTNGTDKKN